MGTRANLDIHIDIDSCNFRDVKCPAWKCQIKVPMKEVVNHLTNDHGSKTVATQKERLTMKRSLLQALNEKTIRSATPILIMFEEQTFLMNSIPTKEGSLNLWFSILGSKSDAQRYEVKISVSPNNDAPNRLSVTEKIVSADICKDDVFRGGMEGVLELNKSLIRKMVRVEGDETDISMEYEITRTRNAENLDDWMDD